MKAFITQFVVLAGLLLLSTISVNAQTKLTGAKELKDINDYATIKLFDKKNNLLEEVVLMDRMSHEEATNLMEGMDLVENDKVAYYSVVSPNSYTTLQVYTKSGKLLEEIILKDKLSIEEAKDMAEGLDVLSTDKRAAYYTINHTTEKVAE